MLVYCWFCFLPRLFLFKQILVRIFVFGKPLRGQKQSSVCSASWLKSVIHSELEKEMV